MPAVALAVAVHRMSWRRSRAEPRWSGDERLASLIANSSDLMMVVGEDGAVRYLSPSVERVLGYDRQSLWFPSLHELVHSEDLLDLRKLLVRAGREISGASLRGEFRLRDADGVWLHTETMVTNHLRDPDIGGLLLNIRNVTERRQLEKRLVHQTRHDPLTGLGNRTLLLERIAEAVRSVEGRVGNASALLFLDLDDFKKVNDTLGHSVGDELLEEIARRLQGACRDTDTIARLGGDEFGVLLSRCGPDEPLLLARRLLRELHDPYAMLGGRLRPTASIGVAMFAPGLSPEELLRRADVAMYAAKQDGKDRFRVFSMGLDAALQRSVSLEADLRKAARDWWLTVHYQPIANLRTGSVAGVEALLRWDHPLYGMLSGEDFLPAAEKLDLMPEITRRVVAEACLEVGGWGRAAPEGQPFLSINVTGPEIRHGHLSEDVSAALSASSLPPSLLVLEINERVLSEESDALARAIGHLEGLGVGFAIDHFGMSRSPLGLLKELPCRYVKLNRSFAVDASVDARAARISRAVVDLAGSLGVTVIAEGLEDPAHLEAVQALGICLGQGYHLCGPLPAYEVRELVVGRTEGSGPPAEPWPAIDEGAVERPGIAASGLKAGL